MLHGMDASCDGVGCMIDGNCQTKCELRRMLEACPVMGLVENPLAWDDLHSICSIIPQLLLLLVLGCWSVRMKPKGQTAHVSRSARHYVHSLCACLWLQHCAWRSMCD